MNIRLFVINLDKDVARWSHMQEQLNKTPSLLPHERFPAIDGRSLTSEQIADITTERCARYCTRSIIGCAASHLSVWRRAVELDVDYAVIFEDDALLLNGWQESMLKILADDGVQFDILFLDIQDQTESFGMIQMQALFDNFLRNDQRDDTPVRRICSPSSRNDVRPIRNVCGLHAYVVSRQGLHTLLDEFSDGISWHLDASLSTRNLALLVADPPLCSFTTAFDSNITGRSIFLSMVPETLHYGRLRMRWLLGNVTVKVGDFEILVVHCMLVFLVLLSVIVLVIRRSLRSHAPKP